MLYLAFKILTSKGSTDPNEKNNKNLFSVGIFLQFVNPKGNIIRTDCSINFYSPLLQFIF